jgi:hypothetical protein
MPGRDLGNDPGESLGPYTQKAVRAEVGYAQKWGAG